jgi:hypothetical protein
MGLKSGFEKKSNAVGIRHGYMNRGGQQRLGAPLAETF